MRIITLYFFVGLVALGLKAQKTEGFAMYNSCSSVKSFLAGVHPAEGIDQTPLLFHYDVRFYHFDLNISRDTTFLRGSVKYLAEVTAPLMDTFAVEFIDEMVIDSIRVNGMLHDFFRMDDEVFVPLDEPVAQMELFTCQIHYQGTPPAGDFFVGVSKGYSVEWGQQVVWTLAEPFNARQWWPAKQVLDDKADSVWMFLTTDASSKAGSIGLLDQVVNLPDQKVRYEWKSRYPIAYYLISYAVADYQDYSIYSKPSELMGDSILIQNFIYNSPGCLEHYKEGIDRTDPMIELFSGLYSLYPFHQEKYGHCLTELSGGMEHQTMTTIGSFGLGIVAHELAHMWFGDNVTCATWSDIWVNEGFATYSDYLAHEFLADAQWAPVWLRNVHDYIIAEPGGSVYVPPDEVYYGNENRIFSARLSYYKGAYLLHMIRYELNDDALFFLVMKNFQNAFKDSVATSLDFLAVLNETTGQDFTVFFDQWFFGEGYPVYNIDWTEASGIFEITSAQAGSAGSITPFFEMKYPVKIYLQDGTDTTIEVVHEQPFEVKTVITGKGVDSIRVDPDLWVLKKVASINAAGGHEKGPLIDLYPNPANEKLFVRMNSNNDFRGSVYDISGKEVFLFDGRNSTAELNIQSLPPGVYLLKVESDKKRSFIKFVKR